MISVLKAVILEPLKVFINLFCYSGVTEKTEQIETKKDTTTAPASAIDETSTKAPRNSTNEKRATTEASDSTKHNKKDTKIGLEDAVAANESESDSTNSTSCPFYNYCNPSGLDLITSVKVKSSKECQEECLKEPKCLFTTFLDFRDSPSCFLLSDCTEQVIQCLT